MSIQNRSKHRIVCVINITGNKFIWIMKCTKKVWKARQCVTKCAVEMYAIFLFPVGPCTLRPTDFRFEMRKPKSGNDPFSVFCFDNRKRKTKKRAVIWFCLMCLNMEIGNYNTVWKSSFSILRRFLCDPVLLIQNDLLARWLHEVLYSLGSSKNTWSTHTDQKIMNVSV